MGAFTISASCDGCSAEINQLARRFGCLVCWQMRQKIEATYCQSCAQNHPEHKPPDLVVEPNGDFKVEAGLAKLLQKIRQRLLDSPR